MRRSPIKQVSKKRQAALREYYKRRIRYLSEHPYCEIFLRIYNITLSDVASDGTAIIRDLDGFYHTAVVPRSTEIHHTKKPKQTYLNDESTWLAASRKLHEWVENNKAEARRLGLLQNF